MLRISKHFKLTLHKEKSLRLLNYLHSLLFSFCLNSGDGHIVSADSGSRVSKGKVNIIKVNNVQT